MIPDLQRQVAAEPNPLHAKNLVREILQAKILGALQRCGAMVPWAFHGGTALRFLFDIDRFSEDLDFALEGHRTDHDFRAFLHNVKRDLERERYEVAIKVSDQRVVHRAFVRFPGLLFELGLPAQRTESLAIKVEVDTRPPAGAILETSLIRKHELLRLQHHDRSSLLAGKLHAVLQRSYTKGRDLFDLLWYLSDPTWPAPNLEMLNAALEQTHWLGGQLTRENWRNHVIERLQQFDWPRAREDLRPFVRSAEGLNWVTLENLTHLLRRENPRPYDLG